VLSVSRAAEKATSVLEDCYRCEDGDEFSYSTLRETTTHLMESDEELGSYLVKILGKNLGANVKLIIFGTDSSFTMILPRHGNK